jgi:hypothetical protein
MADYDFTLERALSDDDALELRARCRPFVVELATRYIPELDISRGLPGKPEFLDVLRTSWRLDEVPGRLPFPELVRGLGWLFGEVVCRRSSLRWWVARDAGGEFLTLGRRDDDGAVFSVPPFSYVEKREHLANAEVFCDFFLQMDPAILGTPAKPK